MNPFDGPPSTPAVSYEPPVGPRGRRGRLIGAALVGAGLVGVGAIGASALVSADDPDLATSSTEAEEAPETTETGSTETTTKPTTEPTVGDGRDVVRAVPMLDDDDLRRFSECVGVPGGRLDLPSDSELPPLDEMFDRLFDENADPDELFEQFLGDGADLDELFDQLFDENADLNELFGEGDWADWGDGYVDSDAALPQLDELSRLGDGLVAVIGPDGPTLIDLGDGDGSVTIDRDGDSGDVTITTEGSATELEFGRLLDEFIIPVLPDELGSCLDEAVTDNS